MVKMIRDKGVKVLSYFIGDSYDMEEVLELSKECMGMM